jgi:hypothetical protein
MSRSRRAAGVLAALVVLAGCSSTHRTGATPPASTSGSAAGADTTAASPTASPTPSATPTVRLTGAAAIWPCLAGLAIREVTVPVPNSPTIPAALLGSGTHAIMFSNQSDLNACEWLPLGRYFASHGYLVALYDVDDPVDSVRAVADYLRGHGARTLVLVGASQGAKTSIIVGATLSPPPDAVVSLSAESDQGTMHVPTYAARLHAPTLFVTADDDPVGSTEPTEESYRVCPAPGKRLIVVPGQLHGVDLLPIRSVYDAVLAFVAAHGGR